EHILLAAAVLGVAAKRAASIYRRQDVAALFGVLRKKLAVGFDEIGLVAARPVQQHDERILLGLFILRWDVDAIRHQLIVEAGTVGHGQRPGGARERVFAGFQR